VIDRLAEGDWQRCASRGDVDSIAFARPEAEVQPCRASRDGTVGILALQQAYCVKTAPAAYAHVAVPCWHLLTAAAQFLRMLRHCGLLCGAIFAATRCMLLCVVLSRATPTAPCGVFDAAVQMHRRFGRLPWAQLVAPAADLAREGFAAHPYLVYVMSGPLSYQRIQVCLVVQRKLLRIVAARLLVLSPPCQL
jgi:hypothetical protein